MLKIRMQRIGRINMPAYRIIVAEHTRSPKTGNIVAKVGTYNPKSKERKLDAERIKYWISVGAQPSPTVHNMLITEKIISGKKINVLPKKSPPRVEEQARVEAGPPAKPADAKTEKPAESPAEAVKEEAVTAEEPAAGAPSEEAKEHVKASP